MNCPNCGHRIRQSDMDEILVLHIHDNDDAIGNISCPECPCVFEVKQMITYEPIQHRRKNDHADTR